MGGKKGQALCVGGEDRRRNHLDSETLAPQEVSRNGACVHASQAQEETRAAANRGQRKHKNKHSPIGKDPALVFSG